LRYTIFLIVSLLGITFGSFAQPLFAQTVAQTTNEPTGLKNVTLWVYPEYDQPSLLVMLEGQITGATLPALVRFLVPQTAQLYSAGSKDATGIYSPGQNREGVAGTPDRKPSTIPGWDEISFKLPTTTSTFRVEYYDDIIQGNPGKTISYDFRWLYPISDLQIIIQQPLKASNFSVLPNGIKTTEDNFNVISYSKNNLTLDPSTQPLHFDISYTKTDPNPSIQNAASSSGTGSSNSVALIFIVLALLIVAVILVLFLMKRKPGTRAKLAPRFEPARAVKSGHGHHGNKFCNQCGQPVGRSGNFCQNCGNKLS
jgi:hypothetical protein